MLKYLDCFPCIGSFAWETAKGPVAFNIWHNTRGAESIYTADPRLMPSQWETSLQCNAVSHWLGANLESAMYL